MRKKNFQLRIISLIATIVILPALILWVYILLTVFGVIPNYHNQIFSHFTAFAEFLFVLVLPFLAFASGTTLLYLSRKYRLKFSVYGKFVFGMSVILAILTFFATFRNS